MFVVTDCTVSPSKKYTLNGTKDVADLVLGITGRDDLSALALRSATRMEFGDTIIESPYFIIDCVHDPDEAIKRSQRSIVGAMIRLMVEMADG